MTELRVLASSTIKNEDYLGKESLLPIIKKFLLTSFVPTLRILSPFTTTAPMIVSSLSTVIILPLKGVISAINPFASYSLPMIFAEQF
ncbi:MAG: hypothetical protein ACXADY_23190 [Candidatus Hodarchaeales archaeon]|jgi:hypothetical protein